MKTKIKALINTDVPSSKAVESHEFRTLMRAIDGGEPFAPQDVIGFINIRQAEYKDIMKLGVKFDEESTTLHISFDNGETFPLALQWTTVVELVEEPQNNNL